MAWVQSAETLSKLIPIAQLLIVILTIFTIWATVQKGRLEKQDKAQLIQEIQQTKSVTSELTEKNKSLEVALTESRNKLDVLHKKTIPRSLTPHQKSEIAKHLSPLPAAHIMVACVMSDNECCKYAEEFNNIFKALNWPPAVQPGIVNKSFLDDAQQDIAVTATANELMPLVDKIISILSDVGVQTNRQTIRPNSLPGGLLPNAIYFIVGTKKVKN